MKPFRPALRAGDWVEVRSREEILATLTGGCVDELPLMPQMLQLAGRRFRVASRAHKTCDTVNRTGGRGLRDAVHLVGSRCDGAAYDGCAAACLIFWKMAWLRRVDGPGQADTEGAVPVSVGRRADEEQVWAATRAPTSTSDEPVYSCQATRLPDFTSSLAWWDIRQYLEDVSSRNVSVREMVGGICYVVFFTLFRLARRVRLAEPMIASYDWVQRRRGGVPFPRRQGKLSSGSRTPSRHLGLQAGDRVHVRPYQQILETLDRTNRNRGMFFDAEEVPYCGQEMTVRHRVDKIVDERTGRMIPIAGDTVVLEGAVCMAHYSDRRMFCPRQIYPFWREVWLERADPAALGPRAG